VRKTIRLLLLNRQTSMATNFGAHPSQLCLIAAESTTGSASSSISWRRMTKSFFMDNGWSTDQRRFFKKLRIQNHYS